MRNAAASFDDDLGYDAAPRRNAPRKPRSSTAGKKRKGKKPRIDMSRVARWAAVGMGATMAVGIVVNALMLQKGHHPAPLFGGTASAAVKPQASAPPVAAPIRTARTEVTEASASSAMPAPVRPDKPATRMASAEPGDAIGNLIAGGPPATAKGDGKVDSKTVAGVQRALTKLGFKVPATGTAGPTTRKAIEAFEKEHHLPVKGDVDRRLVKLLATESKTRIERDAN